ncbi:MAG: ParA family protein [Planctomycetota bacterium]|nr:ParA family protein [Planctomycetota bacterium]
MKTIAVINQKGGTGKTTTAVNLAAGFARRGYWTLLVDLDPQSSAAHSFGLDPSQAPATLSKAILEDRPLVEAIRTTNTEGVEVVLGGPELATLELRIKNPLTAVRVLSRLLAPVRPAYDLCVLDAPPALSLMFTNALSAADGLVVPVTPSFLSAKGLEALFTTIDEARADLAIAPDLIGILMTMVDRRQCLDKEVETSLREVFGEKVLSQVIRMNVRIKEAPGHFRSIFAHAPNSAGAEDYDAVAAEVLARMNLPQQAPAPSTEEDPHADGLTPELRPAPAEPVSHEAHREGEDTAAHAPAALAG